MNVLELKGVSYIYSKGTPFQKIALDDINVAFEKGKITGLIGHTGSGKSTLVNLLNGLYKPTSGTILLDGKSIWEKPKEISKIRYRIGLVMQYPEYQLFDETVWDDIAFGPRNQGLSEEEIKLRVKEAAYFTGIGDELLSKSPFELSGGQKRRVAIAGIIAMEPRCIILDEPTAMLDPEGRRDVMKAIKRLNRELGITVVYITHYMEEACEADRIVVMDDSHLLMDGTPKEIFADTDKIKSIGLDVPQTCQLAKMLKADGIEMKNDLLSIDELVENIDELLKGH